MAARGRQKLTGLGLRPYRLGDNPPPGSVPVSVVVLTRDESVNIVRCLGSLAWAGQVVVIDSGSADDTVPLARSLGAEVVEQEWLGFSGQREFAIRLPEILHDWVYFVDADEWVSPQLAAEISQRLRAPGCAAFSHRLRLVFQGTWIRHCGWYSGSWVVRLVDRRYTKYDGSPVGERATVDGSVRRLANDIVDEDHKGLAHWLRKHVGYAELEVERRGYPVPLGDRVRRFRARDRTDTRPLSRIILKDLVFPSVPVRPLALFLYMYVVRRGFLDGRAGLRFCFFHAWYQAAVDGLAAEASGRLDGWLQQPVDRERSIPIRSETCPGPDRTLPAHLGQQAGSAGQFAEGLSEGLRALVFRGCPCHSIQVGSRRPAMCGADHWSPGHLRLKQDQAESFAAWPPSCPGTGGENEQVRMRESRRQGHIGEFGLQRAPRIRAYMGQQFR